MTKENNQNDLESLYPAGSKEREILEYSKGDHLEKELHPLLYLTFKILMTFTLVASALILFTFFAGRNAG